MKSILWILTTTLFALGGSLWLRSKSPEAEIPSMPDAPAAESAGRSEASQRVAVQEAGTEEAGPALAPHDVLIRDLWSVMGVKEEAAKERAILDALAADGTDGAVRALVEAIEDERCTCFADGPKARSVLKTLGGRTELYGLAQRKVERYLSGAAGEYRRAELRPWLHIALENGGERGHRYVMTSLSSGNPHLASAAANVAASFNAAQQQMLFSELWGGLPLAPDVIAELFHGLVTQADSESLASLVEMAMDPAFDLTLRAPLVQVLPRALEAADLERVLGLYSDEPALREPLLDSMPALHSDLDPIDPAAAHVVATFGLDRFESGNDQEAQYGVAIFERVGPALEFPGVRGALEARAEVATGPLATRLNQLLAK